MAHDGIKKEEVLREVRNKFNEPDADDTWIDPEGVYADSDERLIELMNLAIDDIMEEVPIAERDFLLVGDDRPSPQEWEFPEDCYDIQTVEDQAGYFRYPILMYEERKFARFGFAWVVSGYGSFGPYVRGNKLGFDPRLSLGDFRRVFYWAHPGKFGRGFGPKFAGGDQGFGTSIDVTQNNRSVTITGFTGTEANAETYIESREVLSVRTTRQIPMPNGPDATEIDYDHYVIDEIVDVDEVSDTITILLGTDWKKESATGLSYSIGNRITGPRIAKNAIVYGTLVQIAETGGIAGMLEYYNAKFEAAKDQLAGSWSRWQKQTVDRIREVT